MIRDLYTKNPRFPYFTVALGGISLGMTVWGYLSSNFYTTFLCTYPRVHWWQGFSGIFLHGVGDGDFFTTFRHFLTNMFLFLPYSAIVEKALKPGKYLLALFLALVCSALTFEIFAIYLRRFGGSPGDPVLGAGLSGLAFSFILPGTYGIFLRCSKNWRKSLREPLTVIFLLGFLGEVFMFTPWNPGNGSLGIHLGGVVTGVLLTILFRREIRGYCKGEE